MSRHPAITLPCLIHDRAVMPHTRGLLRHVHPGFHDEFARLVRNIWGELQVRFTAPLKSGVTARRRTLTVLGFARYVVSHKDGQLTLEQVALSPTGRRTWHRANYCFAADLPLMPTHYLFAGLLEEWAPQISTLAQSADDIVPLTTGLARSIRKTALHAVNWKQLRHAVRAALALDPEVLDLARRSRVQAPWEGALQQIGQGRTGLHRLQLLGVELLEQRVHVRPRSG
jgi:hypothetical protein